MRKHGLKSTAKKAALQAAAEEEAEATLDFLDTRAQLGEERVRGGDLSVKLKYRQDKEERLASVLEGALPPFASNLKNRVHQACPELGMHGGGPTILQSEPPNRAPDMGGKSFLSPEPEYLVHPPLPEASHPTVLS